DHVLIFSFSFRGLHALHSFPTRLSSDLFTVDLPADTAPPVRSGGQPLGTLPAGTTQTTLALTTNEAATCRYSPSAGVPYDAMTKTFDNTSDPPPRSQLACLLLGSSKAFY